MVGKVLSKSSNGKMVQLGEDIRNGKWFYFDKVKTFVDKLAVGDEVSYAFIKKGAWYNLSFVAKGNVEIPAQYAQAEEPQVEPAPVSASAPTAEPSAPVAPAKKKWLSKEEYIAQKRAEEAAGGAPKKTWGAKSTGASTGNWEKNTASIERQCSLKAAIEIACRLIDKDVLNEPDVEEFVRSYTDKFVAIIRN